MASRDLLLPNSITRRFDLNNIEHLKAFYHLGRTGSWPNNFLEMFGQDVLFPPGWSMVLQSMMADAWIDHKFQMQEPR